MRPLFVWQLSMRVYVCVRAYERMCTRAPLITNLCAGFAAQQHCSMHALSGLTWLHLRCLPRHCKKQLLTNPNVQSAWVRGYRWAHWHSVAHTGQQSRCCSHAAFFNAVFFLMKKFVSVCGLLFSSFMNKLFIQFLLKYIYIRIYCCLHFTDC